MRVESLNSTTYETFANQAIDAFAVPVNFVSQPTAEYVDYLKQLYSDMNLDNVRSVLQLDTLARYLVSVNQNQLGEIDDLNTALRHDLLTGLGNRLALNETFDIVTGLGHEVELLFIDFNDFKSVNDDFGHSNGDVALVHASNGIGSILRQGELLFRVGGDEFVVLRDLSLDNDRRKQNIAVEDERRVSQRRLDKDASEDGNGIALRIVDALKKADNEFRRIMQETRLFEKDYLNSAPKVRVSASIGIVKRMPGEQLEHLMRRADEQMYGEKKQNNSI